MLLELYPLTPYSRDSPQSSIKAEPQTEMFCLDSLQAGHYQKLSTQCQLIDFEINYSSFKTFRPFLFKGMTGG